ncbi:hypothetical protein [Saccharothrix coeruleofusca]|nr:hypothetical protein [Saccharothrix coeruleofusca]
MFRRTTMALAALLLVTTLPQAPAALADAAGGGGDYVPLPAAPAVLDTRSGVGGVTGERGAASTTAFPVLGVGGVPTSGVGSVVVRITLMNPTESTFAELWPDGAARPTLTHISAVKGETISNFAVVQVGANGKLAVYNASGKVDIGVEVHGYFKSSQGTTGGGFVPVAHTRVVDTREGLGTTTGTIASDANRTVTLAGGLVPVGAAAVVVNLLVPGASAGGWLNAGASSTRPVFNYAAGSTQSQAIIPLSADGKVVFRNNGSAAVNLSVTVQGYFTANASQGAGYRPVAKRLLNTRTAGAGLPVAANGTIDVQVGGTNGLPTRGIAGAAVNVVVTPAEAGYLKAWPVGQAEPSVSVMDFKADSWRDNMIVLKPGTDGKIRLRNGSSGTAHVVVDLLGWFADPLPTLEIAKNTRMAALQLPPVEGALTGKIWHAYVDNSGRVVAGLQENPDVVGAVRWQVLSGNEAFTGQPTLVRLSDGRVRITAQHTDGDLRSITQTALDAVSWGAWADLGGSMASPPKTALVAGTAVHFAVDADGKLWAHAQTGSVPYWRNLGDQDLTGSLEVVAVRSGVQVFGLTTAGSIKVIQYYDDGSVSAWADLGGVGLNSAPSVVVRPGYSAQVFVRDAGGAIVSKLQDGSGAWPADWTPVGALTSAGAPAAILDPALGRVAVVVRGTDGEAHGIWETATASNEWGSVYDMSGPNPDPVATDPFALAYRNSNTSELLFSYLNANGAMRFYGREIPTS